MISEVHRLVMRLLLLLGLFVFLAGRLWAQLPVLPIALSTASSVGPGVPGLAEWWLFTDQTTNNLGITNWFGKIQNTLATNGASTLRPTNSANGVMYGQDNGRQFLTNFPVLDLGSNWTVVVRAKFTRIGYSFSSVYPIWGEFGANFGVGWLDGAGSPKAQIGWNDYAAQPHGSSSINAVGAYLSHMMVNSNNANGVGKMYLYTNAVLVTSLNAQPNHSRFSAMSWMGGTYNTADVFDGLAEDYEIYTNVLTPTQLTTIYNWQIANMQ